MPNIKLVTSEKKFHNYNSKIKNIIFNYFNIIIALVVIAIFVSAYYFLLFPKYKAIQSGRDLNDFQDQYFKQMDYFKQISDLKLIFQNIRPEDKLKIKTIINNKNNQEDIFREIEYIAKKNNLKIDTLKVSPLDVSSLEKLPNFKKLPRDNGLFENVEIVKISFSLLEVDYNNLIKSLSIIESNLRIMDVVSIEMDPIKKTASIEAYTYQFTK